VTPDFKQHHFQCLHNLYPSFQEEVLEEVVNRKVTLEEMKTKAQNFRNMHKIRTAFAKFAACSWEEAAKQYPLHTTEERLSTFLGLDFTKGTPEPFQQYCKAVMRGETDQQQISMVAHKGSKASVYIMDVMELSVAEFAQECPSYKGAHLILTTIPKVPIHCGSLYDRSCGCVVIIF